MNDQQYLAHCRDQLEDFAATLVRRTASLPQGEGLKELAEAFQALLAPADDDIYSRGQPLLARLFASYPEFAPTLPRDLLWFFGGDCLHFMPDDEIALYQQLDELRHQAAASGETLDLQAAKAKLLQLQ